MPNHTLLVGAPTTGQTPLFCGQMAPGFEQNIYDKSLECYCLDAPDYLPTGNVRNVGGQLRFGRGMGVDRFTLRG